MIRHSYPGAQYADARVPDRAFAVLYPMSHLETSIGRITVPLGDEPLYHRIPPTGAVWIAGQAHFGNCTWFYDGKEWRRFQAACGVSPVIFDLMSHLHISDCSIGSQGWRYVQRDGTPEGRLVTGDATYGPVHALNEFTDLGDGLLLGQGNPDAGAPMTGALLWDGSVLRLLEPGACRFIRATREGDRVAVAIWKEGYGSVLFWLDVDELRRLPVVSIPDKAPGPVVTAVPTALKKAEITVDAFSLSAANKLPDGTLIEFHDRENAIGTRARIWVEGGSARMSIDYPDAGPGLKGGTGARRPVR